jgi:hypothetical protein
VDGVALPDGAAGVERPKIALTSTSQAQQVAALKPTTIKPFPIYNPP